MTCFLRATLVVLGAALPLAVSAAGFDADAEGWTTTDGGQQTWVAAGGNGGGWLQVADVSGGVFLLNAPSTWLGNWSAYLGGTISFDALNANGDSPDWASFGEITITGTAGSVVLDTIAAGNPPADGQWHRYSVLLAPSAGWSGSPSPAAVLANVTGLTILGEFHDGITEVLGVDNIEVTAVPVPGQASLLAAGLGAPALLRRKR